MILWRVTITAIQESVKLMMNEKSEELSELPIITVLVELWSVVDWV